MPTLFNAQNAHFEHPPIVVGAITSYSINTADSDTEHDFSTLQQDDLAETTVAKGPQSNLLGATLILIIASVGYLLIRRIRRMKTRRAGRSYF
jgi:hypothetical protein